MYLVQRRRSRSRRRAGFLPLKRKIGLGGGHQHSATHLEGHRTPPGLKPMPVVGPGVTEIRIHIEGEQRVFYAARLRHAIYILHAFRKKSRKTSKADIDLGRARFQEALRREALKK